MSTKRGQLHTATSNAFGFIILTNGAGLGEGNVIANSTATDNTESGFAVDANNNQLDRNTATSNGDPSVFPDSPDLEDGFSVEGNNNLLTNNRAIDNFDDGIDVVSGATGNTLTRNQGSGNASFDLEDDNPKCDANVWQLNVGTRNDPCIQ